LKKILIVKDKNGKKEVMIGEKYVKKSQFFLKIAMKNYLKKKKKKNLIEDKNAKLKVINLIGNKKSKIVVKKKLKMKKFIHQKLNF